MRKFCGEFMVFILKRARKGDWFRENPLCAESTERKLEVQRCGGVMEESLKEEGESILCQVGEGARSSAHLR